MRGGRRERKPDTADLVAVLAGALLLAGCAGQAARRPDAVYQRAAALRNAGDLPAALEASSRGWAAWRGRPASPWHWKFRLLTAEILLARGDNPGARPYLRDSPPPSLPGREAVEARLLADRGYAAFRDSPVGAARLFDQARAAGERASAWDVVAQAQIFRAILDVAATRLDDAEAEVNDAIRAATRAANPFLHTVALAEMGHVLLNRYHYDDAILWSQRSLETAQRNGYQAVTAGLISNLGWCYYRVGDYDQAEAFMARGEALYGKLGRYADQQTPLANLGSVRYSRQDYQGALRYYRAALSLAEKLNPRSTQAAWFLSYLATTHLEMGDPASADAYVRKALDIGSRLNEPVLNAWLVETAAQTASARGDYAAALAGFRQALEQAHDDFNLLWETHAGLAALWLARNEPDRAAAEYRAAVGILDERWSQLLNDKSKLTFPVRAMRLYDAYVDFLMAHRREREALDFVEARRARLLAENLGVRTATAGTARFEGLARENRAVLLSYWLGPGRSYLWVTAAGGFRSLVLPPEPRIRELVDRYSRAIQDGRNAVEDPVGAELFRTLLAPAADLIPPAAHVVLVPDGCLHGLNFETLVSGPGRYWIEQVTLEIAPSLRLLGRRRPIAHGGPSLLAIGNPVQADPALPPLAYAGREIADISTLFRDSVVLEGEAARPEAYRAARPGRFSVIHFAAHAVPNRESPLDSAVVLSGRDSYKLYAWEVARLPLTAGLVTVSACQSAGARAYAGEGLVGFAWAFLHAGARHVVASLWDANDESTAGFMKSLYERVQHGQAPAAALRAVKLEFIRSPGARRKPYYWAPFQVYVQ